MDRSVKVEPEERSGAQGHCEGHCEVLEWFRTEINVPRYV